MESLISSQGRISLASQAALARLSAHEFFQGDLEMEAGPTGSFGFRKSIQFPISLTHLTAFRCQMGYRRNWAHIRANQVGFRVIWFIRKGSLKVVRSQGSHVVSAGQATFIDSGTPFHAKTLGDENGDYESYQLLVPGHLFLPYLQEADRLATSLDLSTPDAARVIEILDLLVRNGRRMSQRLVTTLCHGLLASIADVLDQQQVNITRQSRLFAERFAEVSRHISAHLDEPSLSLESVVSDLGISSRYLCYIFQANRTTFSEFLWKSRLDRAHALLLKTAKDVPIQEIAGSVGFKSSAHFSRLFKAAFALTPSQFRARHAGSRSAAGQPLQA